MKKTLQISRPLVEYVLSRESSGGRFEAFCRQLLGEAYGVHYLPTSASWDLGRDGRTAEGVRGEGRYITASTEEHIGAKVLGDIRRLAKAVKQGSVTVCTSRKISEHAIERLKDELRGMRGVALIVDVLGQVQLADLSVRYHESFFNHYGEEVAGLERTFSMQREAGLAGELAGMRIALTTHLSDDAQQLREDTLRNIVLTTLDDGKARDATGLASEVSRLLHLTCAVHETYITATLENLVNGQFVTCTDGLYSIRDGVFPGIPGGIPGIPGRYSRYSQGIPGVFPGYSRAGIPGIPGYSRIPGT